MQPCRARRTSTWDPRSCLITGGDQRQRLAGSTAGRGECEFLEGRQPASGAAGIRRRPEQPQPDACSTRCHSRPATSRCRLLVTVPRIGAGAGFSQCTGMPPGGWPVAIVQHGITGDRSQALAMADAFADQCFIVVVHGPAAARHHGDLRDGSAHRVPLLRSAGSAEPGMPRRRRAHLRRRLRGPGRPRLVRRVLHQPAEPAHGARQPAPGAKRT